MAGWYGGSGTVPDSSGDDDRGGGGGSGFVWTSSTASNVPSGYSVPTKYYLTNAATYAGNTSFESKSGGTETGHSGNGYARITLISGTTEITTTTYVDVTATRWKNIEYQTEQGTFTGNLDYNGKTITEIDTENNTIIHQKVNEIQYIEATGTQQIDTKICPTSNTMVRLKFNMTAPTGGAIVGFSNSEAEAFRFFNYNNNAYLDYGSGAGYNRINGGTVASGTTYNIEFGNRYVKNIDTDTNIISSSAVSFNPISTSIKIFAEASGKIYYCKIYDNNQLVGDFVPALDENNVPCLYDKVSSQYFYNTGAGTLGYQ